jgi:hypothetical protein
VRFDDIQETFHRPTRDRTFGADLTGRHCSRAAAFRPYSLRKAVIQVKAALDDIDIVYLVKFGAGARQDQLANRGQRQISWYNKLDHSFMHGEAIQHLLCIFQRLTRGQIGADIHVLQGARRSARTIVRVARAGHRLSKCALLAGIPALYRHLYILCESQASIESQIDAIRGCDQVWNLDSIV